LIPIEEKIMPTAKFNVREVEPIWRECIKEKGKEIIEPPNWDINMYRKEDEIEWVIPWLCRIIPCKERMKTYEGKRKGYEFEANDGNINMRIEQESQLQGMKKMDQDWLYMRMLRECNQDTTIEPGTDKLLKAIEKYRKEAVSEDSTLRMRGNWKLMGLEFNIRTGKYTQEHLEKYVIRANYKLEAPQSEVEYYDHCGYMDTYIWMFGGSNPDAPA
jgi:hypothetical protein